MHRTLLLISVILACGSLDFADDEKPAASTPSRPRFVPVTTEIQGPSGAKVTVTTKATEAAIDVVKRLEATAATKIEGFGYTDLVREWNAGASPHYEDRTYIYTRFMTLLKPPIVGTQEIEAIYKSMESSLQSFTSEYTVTRTGLFSDTVPNYSVKMAIRPAHSLLITYEDRKNGRLGHTISSVKGIVRDFHMVEGTLPAAFIRRLNPQEGLLDREIPLIHAMVKFPGLKLSRYDEGLWRSFVGKMPTIIERESTFNGFKCVTLGQPESLTYLCPELNYAKVGSIGGKHEIDRDTGRYVEGPDYQITRHENFQEFANGLWLPRRIIQEYFREGKRAGDEVIEVQKMAVNTDLPDSVFLDVIPDNGVVTDHIRGKSYRVNPQNRGNDPSPEPKERTPDKRRPVAADSDKPDPTGTWKWMVTNNGEKVEVTLDLEMADEKLTGTIQTPTSPEKQIDEGTFKDGVVVFSVTRMPQGQKSIARYSGTLEGDTIVGKAEFERNGKTNKTQWTAKRGEGAGHVGPARNPNSPVPEQPIYKCAVSPSPVYFGRLASGETASRTVRVTCSDKEVSLENLEVSSPSKAITIKKQLIDPQSATLEITFTSPPMIGEPVNKGMILGISGGETLFEIAFLAIRP